MPHAYVRVPPQRVRITQIKGLTVPKHVLRPPRSATPRYTFSQLIQADLYRKAGRTDSKTFLRTLLTDMGFKHVFWLRVTGHLRKQKATRYTLYPLARAIYERYQYKHQVWIPPTTQIGPGLFINHVGNIIVNGRAVIGKNCNLACGTTIGQTNRGAHSGVPHIGDNVFIAQGARIIGGVTIGHNAAIGTNAVVIRDVPDNAVVATQPGTIISYRGSSGYVNKTDYDDILGIH